MEIHRQKRILSRCGITYFSEHISDRGEPWIEGMLGEFTFRYQNYYWIARGVVPIGLAIKLYEDPIGKTDIRSNGHCGCPHPLDYGIEWIAEDGRKVIPENQEEEFKKLEHLGGMFSPESVHSRYIFDNNPGKIAKGIVDMYHIDSELALYIFVKAISNLSD